MAVVFAIRGDSLSARTTNTNEVAVEWYNASGRTRIAPTVDAGVQGGYVLNLYEASGSKGLAYCVRETMPVGFSILYSFKAGTTGSNRALYAFTVGTISFRFSVDLQSSGNLLLQWVGNNAELCFNISVASGISTGNVYDLLIQWDGLSGSPVNVYLNNSLIANPNASFADNSDDGVSLWGNLMMGNAQYLGAAADLIEFVINDDPTWGPTGVTMADDSTDTLDGSRTQLVKADLNQPLTAPSAGIVKTGEVILGVTGTYDGSDRWTDPGESNVAAGVSYKANSTSNNKTGTLNSIEVVTESLQAELVGGPLTGELKG